MSQDNRSTDAKLADKFETTSAFFDEESAEQASIDAWLADDEAVQRWHRYSVISSVMKNDLSASGSIDISERVSAAVAAESAQDNVVSVASTSRSKAARKAASRWYQPVAKVAVAAGVAVVAVMTVQTLKSPDVVPAAQEPSFVTNPLGGRQPVSYSPSVNSPSVTQEQQDMQLRRQAQSYLIDHQQQILLLQNAPQADERVTEKANNNVSEVPQQQ